MTTTNGATQPNKPTTPTAPRRMTLDKVVKGRVEAPRRILLYGTEGIGKSTFASDAPAPIFLGAEDGTAQLDIQRFPKPESWDDVLEAVRVLTEEKHEYQTLALDTLDWAEPLLWASMCARDKVADVESYGYGKGYQKALDEWRVFLAALERLRAARQMHVILLAHAWIKPFKNPEGEDFDRYEMKLNGKAAGLLKEWCDAVLFANYETFAVKKDEKARKAKGVSTGARVINTQRTAAYDAKNRYSLPETLPLSWADFDAAVKAGAVASPADLRAEIDRKVKELDDPELAKKVAELVAKAGDSSHSLALINNRLNLKAAEKAAKGS